LDWRLIVHGPEDGASNMAMDEALFEGVQAGGRPVLRLYRWSPACLSLGRNQITLGSLDARAAAARGIDIVRRPTGGLAVYHDRELTYAALLPVGPFGGPRATYAVLHRAIAAGLRRLGAAVDVAQATTPQPRATQRAARASHPCFATAAPGEVLARGRKLVGSAQRCHARTILQHGSILIEAGQTVAAELLNGDGGSNAAIGIAELLGRAPDPGILEHAIVHGFEQECGITFEPSSPEPLERCRAAQLGEHYRSDEWTWRR
jgi:lipoate-protein ligase A